MPAHRNTTAMLACYANFLKYANILATINVAETKIPAAASHRSAELIKSQRRLDANIKTLTSTYGPLDSDPKLADEQFRDMSPEEVDVMVDAARKEKVRTIAKICKVRKEYCSMIPHYVDDVLIELLAIAQREEACVLGEVEDLRSELQTRNKWLLNGSPLFKKTDEKDEMDTSA